MLCRAVVGFEREYVVSRAGGIYRRLDHHRYRRLVQTPNADKYLTVVLYRGGVPHFKYVQDVVAQAYLNKVGEHQDEVNHKDGDKSNNVVGNLHWADGSENTQHAFDRGLATPPKGEKNGRSKLSRKQVVSIRKSARTGVELADRYAVDPATISLIKNRKRW